MQDVLFIGDAVTACGFRLAGWPVAIAGKDLEAVFNAACEASRLVILTARTARALPPERLEAVYVQGRPLLLVAPDAVGGPEPEDIGAQLRTLIGTGA